MSVQEQNKIILVGRKGSGKSTITSHIHRQSQVKYKTKTQVNVNEFDLNLISNFIYTPKYVSDVGNVITQDRFFQLVWNNFLYLQAMKVLIYDGKMGAHIAPIGKYVTIIERRIKRMMGSNGRSKKIALENTWPDFVWMTSRLLNLIDDTVSKARNESENFITDIAESFLDNAVTEFVFGKNCLSAFKHCVHLCQRRFLFTLNGFDERFDRFRLDTLRGHFTDDQVSFRNKMEIDWLRGLLRSVLDVRMGSTILGEKMDFCITVPKDRVLEIRESERDDYRYRNLSADIKWTGIELAILMHKRVQEINRLSPRKTLEPLERFNDAMQRAYPDIPIRISFQIGRNRVDTSLFVYMLRHTFWRPRDIISIASQIIATAELLKGRHKEIDIEAVRSTVSNATFGIVRSEFINEFQSHCFNLKEVISAFQRSNNIMAFREIEKKIGKVDFQFVDLSIFCRREHTQKDSVLV